MCKLEGGAGAPRTLDELATGDGGPTHEFHLERQTYFHPLSNPDKGLHDHWAGMIFFAVLFKLTIPLADSHQRKAIERPLT